MPGLLRLMLRTGTPAPLPATCYWPEHIPQPTLSGVAERVSASRWVGLQAHSVKGGGQGRVTSLGHFCSHVRNSHDQKARETFKQEVAVTGCMAQVT